MKRVNLGALFINLGTLGVNFGALGVNLSALRAHVLEGAVQLTFQIRGKLKWLRRPRAAGGQLRRAQRVRHTCESVAGVAGATKGAALAHRRCSLKQAPVAPARRGRAERQLAQQKRRDVIRHAAARPRHRQHSSLRQRKRLHVWLHASGRRAPEQDAAAQDSKVRSRGAMRSARRR